MQGCFLSLKSTCRNVISSRSSTTWPLGGHMRFSGISKTPPKTHTAMPAILSGQRSVHHAAIAFGSNMGDRLGYIEAALAEMRKSGLDIMNVSPIYETKPMYYEDQDPFLNGACRVATERDPLELLDTLQAIETKLNRRREIQKGPRTLDLDILLYDDTVFEHPRLDIPHKLLHEREFVLRPLKDIFQDGLVPRGSTMRTVSELLESLGKLEDTMFAVTELSPHLPYLQARNPTRKTHIMAILNLTPDSFSDGGLHTPNDVEAIRHQVREFIQAGATIIDIGGQSTRPQAEWLSPEIELDRILPAIRAIRSDPQLHKTTISVDTFYAQVAREAVAAGADIINDISAGLLDPKMLPTVARLGKTIVLMHMRGNPQNMTKQTNYPSGVVHGVAKELSDRVAAAEKAGIPRWRIILDPGIGFAKDQGQNLELLRSLSSLRNAKSEPNLKDLPWLLGTSRKGFIGKVTGVVEADKRVMGTAATVTASIAGGADIVRVHDVKEMAEVVKMSDAIYRFPKQVT